MKRRMQQSSRRRKLYFSVAASTVALIVLLAMFLVPWDNAETVSLEAYYAVGEQLTYNLTVTSTAQNDNSTASQSPLLIEVLGTTADTYSLNYTITPSSGDATPTTQVLDVNKTDAINLFTLIPAALLQYTRSLNSSSPIETAILNKREAKLGDTLQVPIIFAVTGTPDAEITLSLLAAELVEVEAGEFKVFRLEFTQVQQSQGQCEEGYGGVLGWALLELDSGKQIRSMLEFNMTTPEGSAVATFQSTLIQDKFKQT